MQGALPGGPTVASRHFGARFLFVIALAAFLNCAAAARAAQTIHRHLPAAVMKLRPIGRLPPHQRLDFIIGLPLRNTTVLTNLLEQLYDPGSPQFHHYLTPSQFAHEFGPSQRDYDSVIAFIKASGLTVTRTHTNHTLVDINASVADIERVFHVTLRTYQHPMEARTFFAPDRDPSIDIAIPILSIKGLDNYSLPHRMGHSRSPSITKNQLTGTGPGGYFIGSDYRDAYAPGVSLTGTGQSVALFELDGYFPGDITNYEALANEPNVPLTNILVDGFSGNATVGDGGNQEVALDIEIVISMAPGLSKVLVYEGPSSSVQNFDDILNQIATDDAAEQISSSWGFTIDATTEQVLQQYAVQGQSFFEACGDGGAYPGAVDTPADDPLVTCVGGTVLTTITNREEWSSETTWQDGGGGISTVYAIPSWQQGINMTTNQGSVYSRNVPDVAMVAANCWAISDDGQGYIEFGTSISAPMWAGFIALANEKASASGKPPLGMLNPLIYRIGASQTNYAAAFHDITTGNDTNSSSPNRFFAVPGYDLCTGWGTPAGSNLINALVVLDGTVTTPALFNITSIARTNQDDVLLTWETIGGTTNFVQSAPKLTASFTNLSSAIVIPGSAEISTNFLDTKAGTGAARFYRIMILTPPVADDASQSAYSGGWFYGNNGGSGFGPWIFTGVGPINSQWNGFYIGSSTTNGGSGGPGIDVNGDSWGIYANNGNYATAYRAFAYAPLQVGQSFSLSMDNGYIDSGNWVGFALRNGNATDGPFDNTTGYRFQFVFLGGYSDYYIFDNSGQQDTGIFFTDTGLRFVFRLTTSDSYSLQVIGNSSGTTNVYTGMLYGTPGSGINSIALFNFNAGSSPGNDCFFNSFKITGP
ncbi:MAG TPA: S53 family peptidase [Alphaproteobacteria bacterium]|nr:S53 family peptidase [Alphaproteobacteria bacterium]